MSEHSFFEGPEKKVELVVTAGRGSLRSLGRAAWEGIVKDADASVLSMKSSTDFDAYLLSESSLFVFDDHATMITCGRTRLVRATISMISLVGRDNIELLVYERKNENFPALQHSTFQDDARLLSAELAGQAFRFGDSHADCIEMWVSDGNYTPNSGDVTLEVLMHGLDRDRAAAFQSQLVKPSSSALGLDQLVVGDFEIDEFAFEPAGYSLNALSGPTYYTVHVTPEAEGSYASFETNSDFRANPAAQIERVVAAFQPESFDVLAFAPAPFSLRVDIAGYLPRKQVFEKVAGYDVSFRSFFRPQGLERAVRLLIPS